MKKAFVILLITAAVSCGSNETKPAANETKTADVTTNPDYKKGLDLISKNDCLGCHTVMDASVGPAYTVIAKKYKGQPGIEDTLAQKIIKGGSGNWGAVPMLAHPQISEEDAKAMAKYILTLNE